MAYDSERIGTISQNSRSVINTYDGTTGFLTRSQSSDLGTTVYSNFDGIGRPASILLPGARSVSNVYTFGDLTSVQMPLGAAYTHTMGYNTVDWLQTYTPPSSSPGGATTYGYTQDGYFSYEATPSGVRSRTYDSAGRVSTETYPHPTGGTVQTTWSYSTSGTSAGHLSTIGTTFNGGRHHADVHLRRTQ